MVIGRTARRTSTSADALDHVAGYTLLNDLSARDLQFQTPQWIPGKVFDGSAPCGPALVTADEVADPAAIGIALDLNGERMQEATTAGLIFGIAELRRPPLDPDDARAGRHRLDRNAGRRRLRPATRGSGCSPATSSSSARRSSASCGRRSASPRAAFSRRSRNERWTGLELSSIARR